MGWDESVVPNPQDPETFTRSKLDWSEASEGDHARLLQLCRELAALRRDWPELTDPSFASLRAASGEGATQGSKPDVGARAFALGRGDLSVLVNLTGEPVSWDVAPGRVILLTTDATAFVAEGEAVVPSEAAVIVGPAR